MAKQSKQRQQLGRGLKSLLNNIESDISKNEEVVKQLSHTVAMIPLSTIEVNPFQPRVEFDQEALDELASSIKTYGLIQPITVRRVADNQYQLISGERRMRASKLAKLKEVPAYIRLADDQELMEMALVENIQRQNLNPIEVAVTYQRLIEEFNLTHESMSDRVGKKRSTISNSLGLLQLPPDIQKGLKESKISAGHAKALKGVDDIVLQSALYKRVIEKGLSVRALERLVSDLKAEKTPVATSKKPVLSADYQNVQQQLSNHLETKIQLKVNDKGKGQIVIPFKDTAALNRILELMNA
ncbi:MAG: ParB/RepB/Spo0J family partition protein [Bacteroidota bacterium]